MDYSDDCCMERFTPMQAEKMKYSWTLFREDYYADNVDNSTETEGNGSYTTATSNPSSVSSGGAPGSRTRFGFFTAALVALYRWQA